jgi:hypothetical protein
MRTIVHLPVRGKVKARPSVTDASTSDDGAVAAAVGRILGRGPTAQGLQVPTALGELHARH